MKVVQVLISAAAGAALLGVAISQQSSNSTSNSHTGNNSASATSSSSASSRGFGQQAANASQTGRGSGSGSGSGIHIPKPTHAIFFSQTDAWTQQAYDQIKPARTRYFAKLQAAAKLIYFGPWKDLPGEMSILVGADAEMKQIARDDPAVQAGLLTAEVRGWTVEVEPYAPVSTVGTGG